MTFTGSASATQLRSRASGLRLLARRLHTLLVIDCHRSAGADTWVGPSPQRCDDALRGFPTALRAHADSLLIEARRLDHIASEMEARATLTGPH